MPQALAGARNVWICPDSDSSESAHERTIGQRGSSESCVFHGSLDPFRSYANALPDAHGDAVAVLDAFHVVKVRHEALCVRMGVRDLHRLVVAAAGLKLRAA